MLRIHGPIIGAGVGAAARRSLTPPGAGINIRLRMTMKRFTGSRPERAVLSLLVAAALVCSCGGRKSETASTTPTPAPTSAQAATPPAPPAGKADGQAAVADDHQYDPATAAGAVRGVPAPTNTGTIEAVANFFTEVPGVDLTTLDTHTREKFLHRVNSELCTCGCKNDTIARCAVNDPKCPRVKTLVQKVYDEVKSGR